MSSPKEMLRINSVNATMVHVTIQNNMEMTWKIVHKILFSNKRSQNNLSDVMLFILI